ncbi:MAG: mechanosensitive ion channel [Pirellulales bacterium]
MVSRGARGSREEREDRAKTLLGVFHNAVSVTIVIGGTLMICEEVGIAAGPLMGGAAVFGLAVAFGAQNLIRDYFHGFVILLENQYKLNDTLRIGDISGQVEQITLRMTVLRDQEGNVHFIPNGKIDSVTNMTHGWSRTVLDVVVNYDEDPDHVIAVLRDVSAELRARRRLPRPDPRRRRNAGRRHAGRFDRDDQIPGQDPRLGQGQSQTRTAAADQTPVRGPRHRRPGPQEKRATNQHRRVGLAPDVAGPIDPAEKGRLSWLPHEFAGKVFHVKQTRRDRLAYLLCASVTSETSVAIARNFEFFPIRTSRRRQPAVRNVRQTTQFHSASVSIETSIAPHTFLACALARMSGNARDDLGDFAWSRCGGDANLRRI